MLRKEKAEVENVIEQPVGRIEKKKQFAFLKRREKDIVANLDQKKVKEYDGPFKHRVTGKEFNSFVLETQSAIIQIKDEMLSFTGRVDGIGDDLDKVDKRHNKFNEATVQVLKQTVDDMQQKDLKREAEYKKSILIYQIITIIAALMAVVSFVLFLVK